MDWFQEINGKKADEFCQELIFTIVQKELNPKDTEPYNAKKYLMSQIESMFPDITTIKAKEIKQAIRKQITTFINDVWNIVVSNVAIALRQYKGLIDWCEIHKNIYDEGCISYVSRVSFPRYCGAVKNSYSRESEYCYFYGSSNMLTNLIIYKVNQIYPALRVIATEGYHGGVFLAEHDYYICINQDLNSEVQKTK